MMKCVICAALSAPPQRPSRSATQSRDETVGDRKKFNKVSESAVFVPPRVTIPKAFVFPGFLVHLLYLELNTINSGNVMCMLYVPVVILSCTEQQWCQIVLLSLYHYLFKQRSYPNLFKARLSFTRATAMDLESNNAPTQTHAKWGRLHGFALTWWNHKSSATIQLWINHAECEILPQEKPCECVWKRSRESKSHLM